MLETLLRTKLYVPPLRPSLVPRPELVKRLNEGLDRGCRLTLISAPAGFGKTTLVLEWLSDLRVRLGGDPVELEPGLGREASGGPSRLEVAWLSLDKSDNDPARFLAYLVGALQTVEAGLGESALMAFHASETVRQETVLTLLINDVDDYLSTGSAEIKPLMLILDDYHLIEAEAVHQMLSFILDYIPRQMHVVLTTRILPPLSLARLRGRGQLNELSGDDLRFTPDQVGRFLSQVMGLDLPENEVADLAAYSEGWIAGLQMAAVSLQARRQEPYAGAIDVLVRDNRFVMDYLLEEVLRRQPADVQSFLLRTSLLGRLTGPLCEAVTGQQQGQETLLYLERANLFLTPLDDERHWYRYHQLFAELLRQQLTRSQPQIIPELHRLASQWYEENGPLSQAIDHALASGDDERALTLAEQAAEVTLSQSQVATFLAWMDALPEDLLLGRPLLSAYYGLGLMLGGRPTTEIEAHLSRAEQEHADGPIPGELALNRAVLAGLRGDAELGVQLSRSALARIPAERTFLRNMALRNLAACLRIEGDVQAATSAMEEAARHAQKHGDDVGIAIATFQMAGLRLRAGKLREARTLCERALSLAVDGRGRRLPISARILGLLGDLLREANDLEQARNTLGESIQLAEKWIDVWALGAHLAMARVRQALGDWDGARRAFEQAERLAVTYDVTEADDRAVAAYLARLWLWQGNVSAATQWAAESLLAPAPSADNSGDAPGRATAHYHVYEIEQATLARVLLAEGRPEKALPVLAPLAQEARRLKRTGSLIEIEMLQALAFHAGGQLERALDAFERSLALAEPEGYVRLFVDEGPEMQRLLRLAVANNICASYAEKLLRAFDQRDASPTALRGPDLPGTEPLSERELQVLRLLRTHLTSAEIAQELTISVHTVRFHIKNVYGKLAAHSRSEAVERARELDLL